MKLGTPIAAVSETLATWDIAVEEEGSRLTWRFHGDHDRDQILPFLKAISEAGLEIRDLRTVESSLEDIFLDLVKGSRHRQAHRRAHVRDVEVDPHVAARLVQNQPC